MFGIAPWIEFEHQQHQHQQQHQHAVHRSGISACRSIEGRRRSGVEHRQRSAGSERYAGRWLVVDMAVGAVVSAESTAAQRLTDHHGGVHASEHRIVLDLDDLVVELAVVS